MIVSASVYPGETPSSWMMKGLMNFNNGETASQAVLQNNTDAQSGRGVGNTRTSFDRKGPGQKIQNYS